MQAQITKTQQVFSIIASTGPISASAIANKAGITYRQAYKVADRLMNRKNPLVRKLSTPFGDVQFAATVSKEQAVFNQRKTVAPKLTARQRIYKLLEQTSSYNPTEVTTLLADVSYDTVKSSMGAMARMGVLKRVGYQYAVVPGTYNKLNSQPGRPRKA